MHRRFASLLAATLLLSTGCTNIGQRCRTIFGYVVSARAEVGTATCEIQLGAGANVATYTLTQPCADPPSSVVVAASGSPLPSSGGTYDCHLFVDFVGDDAHELAAYVGSETIPVTVVCDGNVITTSTVEPGIEECGG